MSVIDFEVDYDAKTKRLVFKGGFQWLDLFRSFPNRRFDPKSKTWRMPLVRQNVEHFEQIRHKYTIKISEAATDALRELEALTAGPVYVPFPRDFFDGHKYRPLDHQWEMLDFGWGIKAYALFAAMGTGKTFVTVNMAMARHREKLIRRVAVICPQTLRRTWRREFAKYANPNSYTTRDLATRDPGFDDWLNEDPNKLHILLISVEGLGISGQLYQAGLRFFMGVDPDQIMAVCDESSRIKNPDAVRTERSIFMAGCAGWRMILNGTPIAKGIHDLWAQYEFLEPNIIGCGDYWAFKTKYVVMGGYENKQIIGYANVDELMDMLRPWTLEVDKKVLNLQPKIPKTITIEATPEQKALFSKILTGVGDGPMIQVQNVLERMLRLQQVIGGFEPQTDVETLVTTTVPLNKNPKLDALMELIDDNRIGSKFIIWARYVPEIRTIVHQLRQKYGPDSCVAYYGGTSKDDRAIAEDRYCRDPSCRFLVGNPSAAGLGLTLISGENDIMVYYSGTFAFIDRSQSEDRSHRIGQHNSVVIVDIIMEGSIDELIQASIAAKLDMDQFVKAQMQQGVSIRDLIAGKHQRVLDIAPA
jgi:SNF2 family DNA or RNA helicase